ATSLHHRRRPRTISGGSGKVRRGSGKKDRPPGAISGWSRHRRRTM
ncbi:MAG: hypothetical protein AVDCRST_MAG90-1422, partial [uncultured Microvirga sp.]